MTLSTSGLVFNVGGHILVAQLIDPPLIELPELLPVALPVTVHQRVTTIGVGTKGVVGVHGDLLAPAVSDVGALGK